MPCIIFDRRSFYVSEEFVSDAALMPADKRELHLSLIPQKCKEWNHTELVRFS